MIRFSKCLSASMATLVLSCAPIHRGGSTDSKVASASNNQYCYGTDVAKFSLPIYPETANSPRFTYRLRISSQGRGNNPVIVFLPGGPGYTSMDSQPKGIPSGYRYIATDQRGTGCNNLADSTLPLDALTSKNMAADVVAALKVLGFDNYIIYGHSFGTLHATKVVSKIEDDFRRDSTTKLPRALVLEGTLGKAFPADGMIQSYQDQWDKLKTQIPPSALQRLSQEPLPFSEFIPAGQSSLKWATYIKNMLYLGSFPSTNGWGDLKYSLQWLQYPTPNIAMYNRLGQTIVGTQWPGYFPMFLQVVCAELDETLAEETLLKDGKLIKSSTSACQGRKFEKAYDSKDYYIGTPTYYFQGEADPATPLWQAQYHFKNHGAAERTFIQLASIGHEPLQSALALCQQPIWNSIFARDGKLVQVLKQCAGVKTVALKNIEVNANELNVSWK